MKAVKVVMAKLERVEDSWAPVAFFEEAEKLMRHSQATLLEAHLVRNIVKGRKRGWTTDVEDAIATHLFNFEHVDKSLIHKNIMEEVIRHTGPVPDELQAAQAKKEMVIRTQGVGPFV